jgi:hypothetical protein
MPTIHGLALKIRSCTESETFDLGGLSAETIQSVIHDAFQEPLELLPDHPMIRITLVVGAGKQARQKYDVSALKVVTLELQSLGFVDDKGASCIVECQGMYKHQHDTGKNLKTVVVFPRIKQGTNSNNDHGVSVAADAAALSSNEPKDSIREKVAQSTLNVFKNMVSSRCPTWSQKKALLHLLDDTIIQSIKECDQILISGQVLSPAQQTFYDSTRDLDDKREFLFKELQAHIDRGDLTRAEWENLKAQNESRIEAAAAATSSNSKGHVVFPDKKLQERREKLSAMTPKEPAPLQHHSALGKLWKQLKPLQHIDEHSNQLRSLQETQLLGLKMDLLERIDQLEQASRGWLEDDDAFEARRLTCRKAFQMQFGISTGTGTRTNQKKKNHPQSMSSSTSQINKKSNGSTGTTVSASTTVKGPVTKWVTPMGTKLSAEAKKKARLQKGDVFGAMMAAKDDSDNDDDNDDDDDDDEAVGPGADLHMEVDVNITLHAMNDNPVGNANAPTTNKKKKKNKNKKDRIENRGTDSNSSALTKEQAKSGISAALLFVLMVLQEFLLPFLLGIISWIVKVAFGKPKAKSKKS